MSRRKEFTIGGETYRIVYPFRPTMFGFLWGLMLFAGYLAIRWWVTG